MSLIRRLFCVLLLLQSAGYSQWAPIVGDTNEHVLIDVIEVDDGFLAVGSKADPTSGHNDGWLVKFNKSGNIVWQMVYGGKGDEILNCIAPTGDGGFIVGGCIYSGWRIGEYDVWIIKLNKYGKISWQKTLGIKTTEGKKYLFRACCVMRI